MVLTKSEVQLLGLNVGRYIAGLNSQLTGREIVEKANEFLAMFPMSFDENDNEYRERYHYGVGRGYTQVSQL